MKSLGLDIGGSSVKWGILKTSSGGKLDIFDRIPLSARHHPDDYRFEFSKLLTRFPEIEAIGVGFPNVVKENVIIGEGNMHPTWDRIFIPDLFQHGSVLITGINDTDAAGFAEISGPNSALLSEGVCVFLTLGTGIGSAIFVDGRMIRNTELGLIEMKGMLAEQYTAASIKTRENLDWSEWTSRLQEYLNLVEVYMAPDFIVIGGGISRDWGKFSEFLHCEAKILPAFYREQAGVIGAALFAQKLSSLNTG